MGELLRKFMSNRNRIVITEFSRANEESVFCNQHGEIYRPQYLDYKSKQDYVKAGVRFIEPMNAKEVSDKKPLEDYFNNTSLTAEEKMDGTRATLHIKNGLRLFSRRISSKTDWFAENSDSVPHLKGIEYPENLEDTVLDGEMIIPDRAFKDVASVLNCLWDEAIRRQIELGLIQFNVFDIIIYQGADLTDKPFKERRKILEKVVKELSSPYIKIIENVQDSVLKIFSDDLLKRIRTFTSAEIKRYPKLYAAAQGEFNNRVHLDKQAYYEYIVFNGGEGVILKDLDGVYECGKRTNAFLKVKKAMTRDVIIMDFSLPTKEYRGKRPDTWEYWEDTKTGEIIIIDWSKPSLKLGIARKKIRDKVYIPVSKYYAEQWIGNIIYGVIITDEEIAELSKDRKFEIKEMFFDGERHKVIEIGECSGFDEETRLMFSSQYVDNDGNYIFCRTEQDYDSAEQADLQGIRWQGKCIEVLCNDIFKETGRLRHPRFYQLRLDKQAIECTWKDHFS